VLKVLRLPFDILKFGRVGAIAARTLAAVQAGTVSAGD
jgi:hypothetical protein